MNRCLFLWPLIFLSALFGGGGCSTYRVAVQGVDLDLLTPRALPSSQNPAADHNNLGVLLEEGGDLAGALFQYRRAVAADPELTVAYVNAGNVCLKLNNFPGAEYYYRHGLRLEPDNPRALNNLAWLYLRKNEKIPEAVSLVRKAIQADPSRSYLYLDSLGWALYRAGETKEAVSSLREALAKIPPGEERLRAETHYHLGLIYRETGDEENARYHLRQGPGPGGSGGGKSEIGESPEVSPGDNKQDPPEAAAIHERR